MRWWKTTQPSLVRKQGQSCPSFQFRKVVTCHKQIEAIHIGGCGLTSTSLGSGVRVLSRMTNSSMLLARLGSGANSFRLTCLEQNRTRITLQIGKALCVWSVTAEMKLREGWHRSWEAQSFSYTWHLPCVCCTFFYVFMFFKYTDIDVASHTV